MAKTLSRSSGGKALERKTAAKAKSEKPKKLSKIGEWRLKHPNGLEYTYIDWKAVMK